MTEGGRCPISYPLRDSYAGEVDPEYAHFRDHTPLARVVMPHGGQAWFVTRHEDVKVVLADRRFGRAATLGRDVPRLVPHVQQVPSILTMDPPDHTRVRRLVSSAFTPRRLQSLQPRIARFAHDLVDEMVAGGSGADLVEAFTQPLPIMVMCELLGVPFSERRLFYLWSEGMRTIGDEAQAKMREAGQLPWDYLADRIAIERKAPRDNLLGTLIRARDDGDRLTDPELVSFAVTLLLAGHETTTDELGSMVFTLLRETSRIQGLRRDPASIDTAVEELLRFLPIGTLSGFTRIALEDVELSGGVVRRGEAVVVQADAANHDPRTFDQPDRLDLGRHPNHHLAFGYGPHHCLGAQLARVELRTAISVLIDRLPDLALAPPPDHVVWKSGRSTLGPDRLPVRW